MAALGFVKVCHAGAEFALSSRVDRLVLRAAGHRTGSSVSPLETGGNGARRFNSVPTHAYSAPKFWHAR